MGLAFATELARRGDRVVLVARDDERLRAVRAALPGSGHEVLSADLATVDGCRAVEARLEQVGEPVGLLVTAAGIGLAESFPDASLEDEERQLDVNVRAVLRLCWTAARAMSARGEGAIVTVASTAAVWSTGTYAASKAWVVAATAGLRRSLSGTPVRVLCVVPGFTRSEFHDRAGVDNTGIPSWLWLDPARVAHEALVALDAGRPACIPARRYRGLIAAARLLPSRARARVIRAVAPLRPR